MYQLPTQIQSAAQEQYARDIARVHGVAVQSDESEYQEFLASLGGGGGRGHPGTIPSCMLHSSDIHNVEVRHDTREVIHDMHVNL